MPKPSRPRVPQLELFRPSPTTPAMPPDVCRKTVQLLARLLREHARKACVECDGREVGRERQG